MFNNDLNKEKSFSFYIATVLGKVRRLSNVFSNERTWQLINDTRRLVKQILKTLKYLQIYFKE